MASLLAAQQQLPLLLLLLLHVPQQAGAAVAASAPHMMFDIGTCERLKKAIETNNEDGGAPSLLTLRLPPSEAPYLCGERILVAEGRSVEVVGAGSDDRSPDVLVSLPPGRESESLFVNEGMLKLSNISFHLGGGGYPRHEGEEEEEEEEYACAGDARLVRNAGRVLLEGVEVFSQTNRAFSAVSPRCRRRRGAAAAAAGPGRVVRISEQDKGFTGWMLVGSPPTGNRSIAVVMFGVCAKGHKN